MTREEAIKILQGIDRLIGDDFYSDTTEEAVEMAIEALQTPPITQRSMYQAGYRQAQEDRLKGEWKKATESIWKCSFCNAIMFTDSNYCPNCGAVMRKDETDES